MLVYSLDNVRINDSWYCKDGDTYHSFFLEYANDLPEEYRFERQSCGHMYSKDLIHWTYAGQALKPEAGTWNDRGIATGSVVKHDGKWYMLFTANSFNDEKNGLGIAVSDDLIVWEKLGDGPVLRWDTLYPFEYKGKTVMCRPLADPYIYPEKVDGYYYVYVNSHAVDYPINSRGTTAIFKTKDFKELIPHKLAIIDCCDRMETVQVWKHDSNYYMYAGIVVSEVDEKDKTKIIGQKSMNYLLTSEQLDGPYKRCQKLDFPKNTNYPGDMYIAKVIQDPNGEDVMMINNMPYGVVGPYPVKYFEDGTIQIQVECRGNK